MKENEALNELFSSIYTIPEISDDTLEKIAKGIICNSYINTLVSLNIC